MVTMHLLLAFFLCASSLRIVLGSDWCYHSQLTCNHPCTGPDTWGAVSQHCGGKSQSPINIMTKRSYLDEHLTPIRFVGYQETFHSHLVNTGHSVQLDLPSKLRIKGGSLPATYKAVQLHLHWGKDGGPGSEHTIDGEQFPMEMHIVHIKDKYSSISQAVRDQTGVAVLGFMFQESGSANKKFEPIIKALEYIQHTRNSSEVRGVSLDMLIPPQQDRTKYFRYHGSLTTPSCAEAVVWTVFENSIRLSKDQLQAFSKLHFSDGTQMVRTYRPVQPLNGRVVYYSRANMAAVSTVFIIMVSCALSLHTTA